jgi:hypothetical protein
MAKVLLIILALIAILSFSVYITVSNWNECRDFGHSVMYCMQVISK